MAREVEYWATMEEVIPEVPVTNVQTFKNKAGLQYITFRSCLQAFVERLNRNKRMWKAEFIQKMIMGEVVQEMLANGGVPGEAGHPVPDTAQPTLERICSIDPMRISHYVTKFEWDRDKYLYGDIMTAACFPGDSASPGGRMMVTVLQGITPAFSARTIVPQKKNSDGTTAVLGPGRMIGYDWVFGPSHKEAYRDKSVRINLVNKENFDVNYATESVMMDVINKATSEFTAALLEQSYNIGSVLDKYDPVLETATVDEKGMFSCKVHEGGRLFIPTEENFKKEIASFMKRINY